MERHILVKDPKYEGEYVAFTSVVNHTIIAHGKKPEKVREQAKKIAPNPMVFFVPAKNMTCCY
jgi:hypothetical protein